MYMTPEIASLVHLPPHWGQILTPAKWTWRVVEGRKWCGDNEVFTGKFEPPRFFAWLETLKPHQERCLFIVTPDVMGDPLGTRARFDEYAPQIAALGYLTAFVAQDGQESLAFPGKYDALFVGGSTEWKMSEAADECIRRAKQAGKWVHVGRVNSQRRIRHFQLLGVDSVDGTGPALNPGKAIRVLNKQLIQRPLLKL